MPRGRRPVMTVEDQIRFYTQELLKLNAMKDRGAVAAEKVKEFAEKLEKDTGFTLRSLDIVYVKKEKEEES